MVMIFFRIARIRRRKLFETPSGEVGRCHIRAANTFAGSRRRRSSVYIYFYTYTFIIQLLVITYYDV